MRGIKKSLLDSTVVTTILVDTNYNVELFTSTSTDIFDLTDSDIGRSLNEVKQHLAYDGLMGDVKHTQEHREKLRKVVAMMDGRYAIMQMCPYHSKEGQAAGVVLSFEEATEAEELEEVSGCKSREEALCDLGAYIQEQHNLQAILKRAIDLSCIVLELEWAMVLDFNKQKNTFEIAEHAGCLSEEGPVEIKDTWDIGYALKNKKPTVVKNYRKEDRFGINPFLAGKDVQSGIHTVMHGSEEIFGLLSFYSDKQYLFAEEEINFAQVVAHMVEMAIERERTKNEHEERNKQLQEEIDLGWRYQREILNNNILQQWELGHHLQDNLAQALVSAKLMVSDVQSKVDGHAMDAKEELGKLDSIIKQAITDVRDLAHEIIPIDIEEEGVGQAFQLLIRQAKKLYKIECKLKTGKVINKIHNIALATHLYYVVQEAIKNAAIHDQADYIGISINKPNGELVLRIEDDGIGLQHSIREKNRGQGIRIMKYRMKLLGGTFDIHDFSNADRSGTVVTCTIPINYLTDKASEL